MRRIIERRVMKLHGTWEDFEEQERRFEALEKRLGGFAPKKHYRLISGAEDRGTIIWEREWESLAAMDAAYDGLIDNEELTAEFKAAIDGVVTTERLELYSVITMS